MARKSKSKALVKKDWRSVLAKHTKTSPDKPREKAATGDIISTKGGKFSMGDTVIGNVMDVIVLDYLFENSFYDTPYVDGEANSPACFALDYDEDDMAPHSTSPNKQADSCDECPMNAWGSGDGKGKACGNRRRLAVVAPDDMGNLKIRTVRLSPTSLGNWKGYINKQLAVRHLEPMQAVTTMEFDPTSTASVPPITFTFKSEVKKIAALNDLAGAIQEAQEMLEQPYDVSNYDSQPKKKRAKKKAGKKKAGKKKRSKFSR